MMSSNCLDTFTSVTNIEEKSARNLQIIIKKSKDLFIISNRTGVTEVQC